MSDIGAMASFYSVFITSAVLTDIFHSREVEEPGPGTKERRRRLYEGFTGGSRSANWQLALSAVMGMMQHSSTSKHKKLHCKHARVPV